jgi:ubiquinone/menaquinone biosynthesis C-methylase UbiE
LSLSGGPVAADATELRCASCDTAFPIRLGHPILIPSGALTGPEWNVWQSHLEKFQARRDARLRKPEHPINRLARKSLPQPGFAEFIGVEEGVVLDLGCGPGNFRTSFDADRVRYVGLDPLALPEVGDFEFVQGVAEYLPFKAATFTDIVVLAALDHFRHLDRFFGEADRVLRPRGRIHIMQSVHQVRGPVSAVKVMVHRIKDSWEDRVTASSGREVPKHIAEFTRDSLVAKLSEGGFESVASKKYSATWYSPVKLFMSFQRNARRQHALRATA